jgi:hypothetical protein
MSLNSHEERILRAACSRPVRVREFTEGSMVLAAAPRFVERYFSRLVSIGLLQHRGEQHYATSAGRARINTIDEPLSRAEIRSFTTTGTYTGPNWNIRLGGEDHKRCPSRGIDSGGRTWASN